MSDRTEDLLRYARAEGRPVPARGGATTLLLFSFFRERFMKLGPPLLGVSFLTSGLPAVPAGLRIRPHTADPGVDWRKGLLRRQIVIAPPGESKSALR